MPAQHATKHALVRNERPHERAEARALRTTREAAGALPDRADPKELVVANTPHGRPVGTAVPNGPLVTSMALTASQGLTDHVNRLGFGIDTSIRRAHMRSTIATTSGVFLVLLVSVAFAVQPTSGGTLVFPIFQEPGQINPFLAASGEEGIISKAIYEGLVDVDADGAFYPRLARELPSYENGGLTEDGLEVTWRLREGVLWSDGEAFTSDDVVFTWEAVTHPESSAFQQSQGWSLIESIETPDDLTLIVKYSRPYANYLDQFSGIQGNAGILPRHACGEPGAMLDWECNREPVGTGPYTVEDWKAGDSLSLVRNPFYRDEAKPYIDRIVLPIIPSATLRREMMVNGQADALFWIDFEYTDALVASGAQVTPNNDMWLLRLGFNLSDGGNVERPHPVLGDRRVRQAIRSALNPRLIVDGVQNGLGSVVAHDLFRGLTQCPDPVVTHNKDEARSLLEEAGWLDTDGDGVRECHSCVIAEEGTSMELEFIGFSEPPSYPVIQQVITDELADIGIRLRPSLPDDAWELVTLGEYDVYLADDGYVIDPSGYLGYYYSSLPEYTGADTNVHRFSNAEFDALFGMLPSLNTADERFGAFCEIDRILFEEAPTIPLATIPFSNAFSPRVAGWEHNPNEVITWDVANWWLMQE
jgi:peptide/nickel transport system substrate-binding protein